MSVAATTTPVLGDWVFLVGCLATAGCYFPPLDHPEDATSGVEDNVSDTDETGEVGPIDGDEDPSGESTAATAKPNGRGCEEDHECASERCYSDSLIRACGECRDDDDCAMGCTPPIFGSSDPTSECNAGALGAGCQSDAACIEGLTCAETFSIPALISYGSCSECSDDSDCAEGTLCVPDYDFARNSGVRTCGLPGVRAVDDPCDHLGSGDASCLSGICNPHWVSGLLEVGVCGECRDDGDCGDDRCESTSYSADLGLHGSRCVR